MKTGINKSLAIGLSLAAMTSPALADQNAEGNWTFRIGLGSTSINSQKYTLTGVGGATFRFEDAADLDLALGYDWGKFRTEFEYSTLSTDIDDYEIDALPGTWTKLNGPLDIKSYSLKGYYDFRNGQKWQPYVGAGIGTTEATLGQLSTHADPATKTAGGKDSKTSYSLIAGLNYSATEKVDLYTEYEYRATEKYDLGANYTKVASLDTNTISAGVRFKF